MKLVDIHNRLKHRIGRRGASLLFFGIVLVTSGLGFITTPAPNTTIEATKFIYTLLPREIWGAIWLTIGLIALVAAFRKDLEVFAFSAAASIFALWGLGYLVAAFVSEHFIAVLMGAAIWFAVGGYIMIVSGWTEVVHIEDES